MKNWLDEVLPFPETCEEYKRYYEMGWPNELLSKYENEEDKRSIEARFDDVLLHIEKKHLEIVLQEIFDFDIEAKAHEIVEKHECLDVDYTKLMLSFVIEGRK